MASSQSFSMIHRRMLLSPWPASPVNRELPLWTSAMRLPNVALSCFILLSIFARNISWPSLMRVMSESSGSLPCWMTNLWSVIPDLPPIRSRSVFQLLPYGGLLSMKSKVWVPNASLESVECCGPPTMLASASFSPLNRRSALQMA